MHRYRTHTCGALRDSDIGKDVRLSGWCHRIRDHGGAAVHRPARPLRPDPGGGRPGQPGLQAAETLRSEWVVRIDGKVRQPPGRHRECRSADRRRSRSTSPRSRCWDRPASCRCRCSATRNIPRKYGSSTASSTCGASRLHENIMMRGAGHRLDPPPHEGAGLLRIPDADPDRVVARKARATILVPSRIHPGKFYALPQAPQQFKQLIMVSGFDRYFQIAPCFRDEDARADRSPGEFYQLDLEMSFVTQEDVFDAVEPVMRGVFEEFADGKPVTPKFPLIPYAEAMRKYGTDKPDLRNPIEMQNVTEAFRGSGFKMFASMLASDPKARSGRSRRRSGGNRALLRPHELLGAAAKASRGSATSSGAKARRAAPGPLAKNHRRRSAPSRSPISSALGKSATRCFFVAGKPKRLRQVRRPGAHQGRRGARPHRQGPLRLLLDRRLPDVRMERGGEEDRLLAQPVLDAEHGRRGIPRARRRRTRTRSSASRRSSTTSSATASSCRPARSAIIAPT